MRHPFRQLLPGAVFLAAGMLAACSSRSDTKAVEAARPVENALLSRNGVFNQEWAMNKLWEDGQAEVATYNAERTVYGEPRRFEYTLITVKEEFNQQYNVKTDDYQRKDLFPVMKVNEFCAIPTDNYPYHYLTSLFFRRDQPVALHKLTTSSQEWCGNTFKSVTNDGLQYTQSYNSYWDGQGAGRRQLRHDVLFEDALPYTLRTLRFEQKPAFEAAIYELQQTSKAAPPVLYHARLRTEEADTTETLQPAWRVVVELDKQKQNVYWFGKEYPNPLLRQTTWDHRTLALKQLRRFAYWPPAAPPATPDSVAQDTMLQAPVSR